MDIYNPEQIHKMSNNELLATLDDMIQVWFAKESNLDWMKNTPEKKSYRQLRKELSERLK